MRPELYHSFFSTRFVISSLFRKYRLSWPARSRAVAEDDCGDTVVTLTHHEVGKPGDFVHDRFFRDLEHVAEEIRIAPEIRIATMPLQPIALPVWPRGMTGRRYR